MRKPKRARPKSRKDRARVHEINRLLNGRSLDAGRRTELEAERERLSPVMELTRAARDAWVGRIEAAKDSGSLSGKTPEKKLDSSDGTPVSLTSKPDARTTLARKLDEAKTAFEPQIRAKKLDIDDALCNFTEAHARFGYEIWTGRNDWEQLPRREARAAITTCQLKIWRKERIFTRPTWGNAAWEYFAGLPATEKLRLRQTFEKQKITPAQWRNTFKQLNIVERMQEVMPERYLAESQQSATEADNAAPVKAVVPEPEPRLDPIVQASANLAARAALLLQTDSFLSRLAQHSDDMRTKILAAISDELLRAGVVSGEFCARTYNTLRPRAVAAFPERKF